MNRTTLRNWVLLGGSLAFLAACAEGAGPFAGGQGGETGDATAEVSTRIVERDVEAPNVFSVTEAALWDGRPSLGGVWVAHPTATDPERVIIRNPANGKFVIGALFRRERDNPGPRLQASSDAASALGLLAGQPTELSVIALRREEVPEPVEAPIAPILDSNEQIATETLGAPAAGTGAVATAPIAPPAAVAAAEPPKPAAKPAAPAKPAASGGRNQLQIGIFSVEANAKRAADQLKGAGATATIKKETSQGKTFWRVLAGPATTAAAREALKKTAAGLGYGDAYFVSR